MSRRRNNSGDGGRSGGGLRRLIRWIIKIKLALILFVIIIIGLIIWAVISFIGRLFGGAELYYFYQSCEHILSLAQDYYIS